MYWDILGCVVYSDMSSLQLSHLLCVSGFGIFEPLEPPPCVSVLGRRNGGCHVVPQRVHLKKKNLSLRDRGVSIETKLFVCDYGAAILNTCNETFLSYICC